MTSTCLTGDVNFDFLFKVVSVRFFHFKAAVSPISNSIYYMKMPKFSPYSRGGKLGSTSWRDNYQRIIQILCYSILSPPLIVYNNFLQLP